LKVTASSLSAAHAMPVLPNEHSVSWASGTFGLLAIVFVAGSKRHRRTYAPMVTILLIAMVAILGAAGCGGGSSSASSSTTTTAATAGALTGVVTVQATSGSTTHSVQVLVTVN
jgi:drug/metabolite transporter (DMT)-like permease